MTANEPAPELVPEHPLATLRSTARVLEERLDYLLGRLDTDLAGAPTTSGARPFVSAEVAALDVALDLLVAEMTEAAEEACERQRGEVMWDGGLPYVKVPGRQHRDREREPRQRVVDHRRRRAMAIRAELEHRRRNEKLYGRSTLPQAAP